MSLKVLLVEDDESLTRELEHALVERACEVTTIGDAEEGLGAAASQRFDVILLSTELSERMQRDPATAGVPFVVISKPVVIPDLIASLPERRRSVAPSLAPSGDLRETIKNQARTVATLRADLATRGQTIDRLTKQVKELTQRLTETLALLESEQKAHAHNHDDVETLKQAHAAKILELEAQRAAETAERERAHAEETAFLERAHEEANEAAARRLRDSERNLATERQTFSADSEAHTFETSTFREIIANLERERDAAIAERDDARALVETTAMDVAQAQMDLAEVTRARANDAHVHAARLADLEAALANEEAAAAERASAQEQRFAHEAATTAERFAVQEQRLGSVNTLESQLAAANAKVTELNRALEAAEREAIQAQLARDAAFHEMNVRAAADLEAAVKKAKDAAAVEREELMRGQEAAIKQARDKAIAQTLAVARERKKQNE